MDQILSAPPGDGISCLSFAPASSGENLLVTSWDSTTRLYDSIQNFPKATFNFRCLSRFVCLDYAILPQPLGALNYEPLTNFVIFSSRSGACLACCFDDTDGNTGFCGGLDTSVSALDLSRGCGAKTVLGGHQNAVSCLQFCPAIRSL